MLDDQVPAPFRPETVWRCLLAKPALRQVPKALLASPTGDRQPSLHPEELEHPVDVAAHRPAARLPVAAGGLLKVAGAQRPSGGDLAEDAISQVRVLGHPGSDAGAPAVLAALVRPHPGRMDREVLGQDNRGGVGEVMKEEALLEEQAVEQALVEGTEAAKRNQQLGGDAGERDRSYLEAPQW